MTDINNGTPGVYIQELNEFPNPVLQVPTAIPAFIGYTPQASYQGKSYTMIPLQITSMLEFDLYFSTQNGQKQYAPSYYLQKVEQKPVIGDSFVFNGDIYTIEPDPNSIYYLYNAVQLFFQNGGGNAYIVSVGSYGDDSLTAIQPGQSIENPNIKLKDLQEGLSTIIEKTDITLYVIPEATLLSNSDYSTIMQSMLEQSLETQTAMSLFDVKGGASPNPKNWKSDISNFRSWIGTIGLNYGACYYPFLNTDAVSIEQIDYTNINNGDISILFDLLNPSTNPNPSAITVLNSIKSGNNLTATQNNQALMAASTTYVQLIEAIQKKINILPPSSVMAGLYTTVDQSSGVWTAPANIAPIGVTGLTISLNDEQQQDLNLPIDGKSVNAFRLFSGLGILVWGARTLTENSYDWRYIPVRRTAIMIEQSCKNALQAYAFAENNAVTWSSVKKLLENFLLSLWKEGALKGQSPSDAYTVSIGLDATMTAQDILDGRMIVSILIALVHPAEYIEINLIQYQQTS